MCANLACGQFSIVERNHHKKTESYTYMHTVCIESYWMCRNGSDINLSSYVRDDMGNDTRAKELDVCVCVCITTGRFRWSTIAFEPANLYLFGALDNAGNRCSNETDVENSTTNEGKRIRAERWKSIRIVLCLRSSISHMCKTIS